MLLTNNDFAIKQRNNSCPSFMMKTASANLDI